MPFLMAANGPRALRFAARLGEGWVTTGPQAYSDASWWAGVAELAARLDEACAAEGRDPATIHRVLSLDDETRFSLSSVGAFEHAVGRAAELGFTDVISHWPREQGIYAGSEAVLEEVASRLPSLR